MESTVVAATREIKKTATAEQVAEFDRGASVFRAAGLEADVRYSGKAGDIIHVWVMTHVSAKPSDLARLAGIADDTFAALSYYPGGTACLFLSRPPTAEELANEELWR